MVESVLAQARRMGIGDLERAQAASLQTMRSREPLPPGHERIDTNPKNPELVTERLGHVLPYFRDVESLVEGYHAQLDTALGPSEFRELWGREEPAHGKTIHDIILNTGQDSELPEIPEVSAKFVLAGLARLAVPVAGEIVGLTASGIGYVNEAVNMVGQRRIGKVCKEIGEKGLRATFGHLTGQERTHRSWYAYDVASRERRLAQQGRPWVIGVARSLASIQSPVGANGDTERRRFGEVEVALAEGDMEGFMGQLEQIIHDAHVTDGDSLGIRTRAEARRVNRQLKDYYLCRQAFEEAA